MIGIVRDTWRAVLVLVVAVLLRGIVAEEPAPASPPTWQPAPIQWQPPPVATGAWQPAAAPPPAVETKGPIRRVARELVDLSEAVIGVLR
jgi:hypothetical protein